jgi:hypothetical protein
MHKRRKSFPDKLFILQNILNYSRRKSSLVKNCRFKSLQFYIILLIQTAGNVWTLDLYCEQTASRLCIPLSSNWEDVQTVLLGEITCW